MVTGDEAYGMLAFLCFVISAKWAKELGYNQGRQLACALGGILLGPIMPLVLYVRGFYEQKHPPRAIPN